MPRLGIGDLAKPPKRLRPSRVLLKENTDRPFEAKEEVVQEAHMRAKLLRQSADKHPETIDPEAALGLAKRLSSRPRMGPHCLCDPRLMRRIRNRVGGWLWHLVDKYGGPVCTVTLVPRGWAFTPDELQCVDPNKLLNRLRTDLLRCAPNSGKGWAIYFLHGEFQTAQGAYPMHVHGVAGGAMVKAVDALRKRKNYASTRKKGQDNTQRVVQSQKPLTNLPEPLTYLLKSYWPKKWKGYVSGVDTERRSRDHGRIPEPYHSQYLLWLDQLELKDITLLMGVRVGKKEFILTGQK